MNHPATTILASARTGDGGGRVRSGVRAERTSDEGNGVRITLAEALILQDFPPDYPVQGTNTARFLQIGNAIPPGLARAVLKTIVGDLEQKDAPP